MRFLPDTNIVLRAINRDDPSHPLVSGVVQALLTRGDELVIVSQAVHKFWSVATRPAQVNGLGWSVQLVRAKIDDLVSRGSFLGDAPEVFRLWLELVTTQQVSGKQVHDVRLAALLKARGVETLLTLNSDDFRRFDIGVVHPREVQE